MCAKYHQNIKFLYSFATASLTEAQPEYLTFDNSNEKSG